jgi:cytidylate kinase
MLDLFRQVASESGVSLFEFSLLIEDLNDDALLDMLKGHQIQLESICQQS